MLYVHEYCYNAYTDRINGNQWIEQQNAFAKARFGCPLDMQDTWKVPFCDGIKDILSEMRKTQNTE